MKNITFYTLNDILANGFRSEFLDISFLVSVVFGIFVITSKNPVMSVLCLIGLFLSISSYLMLLGLNFIALSYLLVYVGAVSILFLFILMLINIRTSELLSNSNNSLFLGIVVSVFFNSVLYTVLPYGIAISGKDTVDTKLYSNTEHTGNDSQLVYVTGNTWDGSLAENTHITSIGNIMYTSHSIWLILTSIILLLAMVGAIVITVKQKENKIIKLDKINNLSKSYQSSLSLYTLGNMTRPIVKFSTNSTLSNMRHFSSTSALSRALPNGTDPTKDPKTLDELTQTPGIPPVSDIEQTRANLISSVDRAQSEYDRLNNLHSHYQDIDSPRADEITDTLVERYNDLQDAMTSFNDFVVWCSETGISDWFS